MYIFIILIHIIYIISYKNDCIKKYKNIIFYKNYFYSNKKIIKNLWENDISKDYIKNNSIIKYSFNYTVRSYINFNKNILIIETINKNYIKCFKKEIRKIFLKKNYLKFYIKKNYNNFDEINEKLIKYNLYILNFKNNIENYINIIINENIKNNKIKNNLIIKSIKINLSLNDKFKNNSDYIKYIKLISKKYNIDFLLILSLIKIESNFNKYAISKSGAIGLMQIIKNKSCIDVFRFFKKKKNINFNYLLNSKNNIYIGMSYVFILQKHYLSKIINKKSLRYITIASYNGGINSVLKIFSKNYKNSINLINSMKSIDVYNSIILHHNSLEIRKYLKKVNNLYEILKINDYKYIL